MMRFDGLPNLETYRLNAAADFGIRMLLNKQGYRQHGEEREASPKSKKAARRSAQYLESSV